MITIRKLISAYMTTLVVSLLLPLVNFAAVSGTMHETPCVGTTLPVTTTEHTTTTETVRESISGSQAEALSDLSRLLPAPKTTPNRVFWSGGTTAREGAEAFARQTGGQTLEMTRTGRFLDAITTQKTYPYLKPAWNKASQNFARGADGAVDVFQSSQGVRLESVWKTVEYPELMKAGNAINFHVTP